MGTRLNWDGSLLPDKSARSHHGFLKTLMKKSAPVIKLPFLHELRNEPQDFILGALQNWGREKIGLLLQVSLLAAGE